MWAILAADFWSKIMAEQLQVGRVFVRSDDPRITVRNGIRTVNLRDMYPDEIERADFKNESTRSLCDHLELQIEAQARALDMMKKMVAELKQRINDDVPPMNRPETDAPIVIQESLPPQMTPPVALPKIARMKMCGWLPLFLIGLINAKSSFWLAHAGETC